MIIYLVRHADALDGDDDAARPLSARGHEQTRKLADFLGRGGVFTPAEIWHSPLVRARQTAELFTRQLALKTPLSVTPDFRPEDDPRAAARRLKAASSSVAVFGHEPHLSALATLLVTGKMEPPTFLMKKCAALALDGAASHWMVRWHVSPELIG